MAYNEKDVNINFRVSRELRDKMHLRAKQLDMNVSQFFRNCMEEALKADNVQSTDSNIPLDNTDFRYVNFRCSKTLYDEFASTCAKINVTKSSVLRNFLANFIKQHQ